MVVLYTKFGPDPSLVEVTVSLVVGELQLPERKVSSPPNTPLEGQFTPKHPSRLSYTYNSKTPAVLLSSQESLQDSEKRREKWEEKQRRKRRIRPRSVSKEKWVETLVVADTKMVEYHGADHVEKYVLTIMNMVAGLFHDASIGNPIHISVVRLIFLEEEEEDLKITHHADNTLRSFCKWQKAINVKGDAHPLHHDVAILLTRKDLCTAMNQPCETLGLSHVSGMCQPHRSCNINEDTGLPLAFTVAHELGHSFGIQHDGSGNDCEPVGKRPFIMSPQLLYDTSPLTWSHCSRQYITRFLDRGWGLCLDDPPAKDVIDFPSVPPGVLYDVGHQCRLQYGPYSTYCDDMDVRILWAKCNLPHICYSKCAFHPQWCFDGDCVHVGYRPESTHGGWSAWGSWASCSRTCGAGVQSAERQCDSPMPKYGGKYCLGERKRFRVCSTQLCPAERPSFRQIQCSRFDARPYKGKFYKWTPVPHNSSPCELHCRPEKEYFAEKLRDAVLDGTPCYEGTTSRDLCINGICKNVGCDYEIDSYAEEDRCGVCRGDGSTCQTVTKTFEEYEGLGYVDVGLIPAGAREIQIEEVAEAENFLALRSEDPEKYFLNGGWTIQWNGEYKVAGTTFTYERMGNWENLTSPGPTREPVWIQLLFQEKNPGVRYQYTIQRESEAENEILPAEFSWKYGPWTKCTATCGTGVQRQMVHCVEKVAGAVEERYCQGLGRPDDKQRSCSEDPCPARWWTGEWQSCSATCGDSGLVKRTVLCIQSVTLDEQKALPPSHCQHLSRPDATAPCNREVSCPAKWATGNWSECSVTCGSGAQRRPVFCPRDARAGCDPLQRPASETSCVKPPCRNSNNNNKAESTVPDWSGSGSSNEINFIPEGPMHRFSPSSPRSEDLNVITEEDFSSPDGSPKGNVFVDDFYYDYNFINFHEDLSYDSAGEDYSRKTETVPDMEVKTVSNAKEDSPEMGPTPTYFPTMKPEVGMGSRSSPTEAPENSDRSSTQETPGDLSEEDKMSPTSLPSLAEMNPSLPLSKEYNSDESRMTQLPESRMEDPGSSAFPNGLWTMTESGTGEASTAAEVSTEHGDNPATPQFSSVTTGAPRTSRGSSPLSSQAVHFAGTTPALSDHPGPPGTPREPLPSHSPTLTPTSVAQGSASPGPLLSRPAAPRWKEPSEMQAGLGNKSLGGRNESAPNGLDWAFAGLEPNLTSAKPVASSSEPPSLAAGAFNASWEAGNWSECSTTCGLGAMWRTVRCSAGKEEDCSAARRPVPARRCYLRPCSTWRVGNWSKCSKACGGGVKVRDAQCVDTRDQRPLRPFHCQALPAKPPTRMPCHTDPCLGWYTSAWRECSELCGGGEQERLVTCPEFGRCDEALRPNTTRPCHGQPCARWTVGPWGQCSVSCGGGIQRRQVKCVNTKTGEAEEDRSRCGHQQWPENIQKCGLQDCGLSEPSASCERDRLSLGFCQTLRLLGRCPLPTVRAQCCQSCQRATNQSRGEQRASRK
uniref:ADAM metallopeptidase with thrombospondin type 1 motif 7 n=1 Tax=Anolis carolinensis TaxID=28377 RepID=A0A803TW16_ANOCA